MRDNDPTWPRRAIREDDAADMAAARSSSVFADDWVSMGTAFSSVRSTTSPPVSPIASDGTINSNLVLRPSTSLESFNLLRPVFLHARRGIAPIIQLSRVRGPLALTAGPSAPKAPEFTPPTPPPVPEPVIQAPTPPPVVEPPPPVEPTPPVRVATRQPSRYRVIPVTPRRPPVALARPSTRVPIVEPPAAAPTVPPPAAYTPVPAYAPVQATMPTSVP
ncbi:MAG: hypothetical protein FWD80_04230, partial [Propionibacteriaceae bacterium]|nr:hypothetical protein [Propionibacteriaceae bacterium]